MGRNPDESCILAFWVCLEFGVYGPEASKLYTIRWGITKGPRQSILSVVE